MRLYLESIFTFLKASGISLFFGICWTITFYGFDHYTNIYMRIRRNDFFFDIVLFFLSGLVGALLFLCIMSLFEKIVSSFIKNKKFISK